MLEQWEQIEERFEEIKASVALKEDNISIDHQRLISALLEIRPLLKSVESFSPSDFLALQEKGELERFMEKMEAMLQFTKRIETELVKLVKINLN